MREVSRAVSAALATASSQGLTADDAIVLQDSDKLTLRLLPCDVVARVAPAEHQVARFEIEIAQGLARSGSPAAALDPRVEPRAHDRDGFVITLWTYYAPGPRQEVAPADYADALVRLHAGMRTVEVAAPHFTDRVEDAQRLLASRDRSPALPEPDRKFLRDTLRRLPVTGAEQLLHGEPHPDNLLATDAGLLFIDLETCCRGPVEFDVVHAPPEVGEHYPGVDPELLRQCRLLMLAMITTWRWDRDDQLPDGRRRGAEWLSELRTLRGG
jgi:aminoglycoside phosphotransferase (APT) family kinase protein